MDIKTDEIKTSFEKENKTESEILVEILQNMEKINKNLKEIKNHFLLQRITRIIYWAIILILLIFAAKSMNPLISEFQNNF